MVARPVFIGGGLAGLRALFGLEGLEGPDIGRVCSSPMVHAMKWGLDSWYHHPRGHMPPEASQNALPWTLESSWIQRL